VSEWRHPDVRSSAISLQRESRHKESPSCTDVKENSLRNSKPGAIGTKTGDLRRLIPEKKRKLGRAKHATGNKTTASPCVANTIIHTQAKPGGKGSYQNNRLNGRPEFLGARRWATPNSKPSHPVTQITSIACAECARQYTNISHKAYSYYMCCN
jgi:hypothetical protein